MVSQKQWPSERGTGCVEANKKTKKKLSEKNVAGWSGVYLGGVDLGIAVDSGDDTLLSRGPAHVVIGIVRVIDLGVGAGVMSDVVKCICASGPKRERKDGKR